MILKTSDLRAALARIKPAVSARTTLPVLQCVKIDVRMESVRLLATDLDQWLQTYLPAQPNRSWSYCVRYDRLERAAKFWVADDVSLTPNEAGTAITAKCGAYTLPLPTMPATEMPEPPKAEGEALLVPAFGDKLRQVAPFCSTDASKPPLLGVHLGDGFMEGCDGKALLRVETELKGAGFLFPSAFVPSVPTGEAIVHLGNSLIAVTVGDTTLTTKRLEGDFPNTDPFMQSVEDWSKVTCWREELLSAVQYCESQSKNGAWTNVWLDMGKKAMTVRLSKADSDGDAPAKELPCHADQSRCVAVSAPRLADLLKAFGGDEVTLCFGETFDPLIIERSGVRGVSLLSRIQE